MLHSGRAVEVEIFLDLALAFAGGGFVDGHLDQTAAVPHHLRHQSRVLGRDRLVIKVAKEDKAEDVLIELDPSVHLPELDVADDMVDAGKSNRLGDVIGERSEAGRWPGAVRLDQRMDRLPISTDAGLGPNLAAAFDHFRLVGRLRPPGQSHLVSGLGIGNGEGDIVNAGTVLEDMAADGVIGKQGPGDDEAGLTLTQRPTGGARGLRFPALGSPRWQIP